MLVTGGVGFASALVLAFAYTSTQDDRGMKTVFIIAEIPVQWIPYAMLLMTYVVAGSRTTMIEGTGLIAAHLHDFLTHLWPKFGGGRNLLPTPDIFKQIFRSERVIRKPYVNVNAPAQPVSSTSIFGSFFSRTLPKSQPRQAGKTLREKYSNDYDSSPPASSILLSRFPARGGERKAVPRRMNRGSE